MEILGFINILAWMGIVWVILSFISLLVQYSKLTAYQQRTCTIYFGKETLVFLVSLAYIIWYW